MAVTITEPKTGLFICEMIIESTEQLRKLEQEFVVTISEKEE